MNTVNNIGFTGTEKGMTERQKNSLYFTLLLHIFGGKVAFHHGDCVGSDSEAHNIAHSLGYKIIIPPPHNSKKRAYCKGADGVRFAKEYLQRNHDIVDESDILIACPAEQKEILRSGVWATVRYARKKGKRVQVIYP